MKDSLSKPQRLPQNQEAFLFCCTGTQTQLEAKYKEQESQLCQTGEVHRIQVCQCAEQNSQPKQKEAQINCY